MVDAVSAASAPPISAASRAATADKIFSVLDPKNTGKVQKSDFLQLYSLLGGGNSAAGADSFGISATSYNVAPTTYGVQAESYVPAEMFLQASSAAVVHASNVFSSLDTDKSGALSKAEFLAGLGVSPPPPKTDSNATATPATDTTSPPTPTTPSASDALVADATAQADQALALFDTQGKGYFDVNDVTAAFTKNPLLGDAAKADQTVAAWDDNKDGKVTRDELISGYTTMNLADSLMNQLDPTGQGYIDTSKLSTLSLPNFPNAATVIAGWDKNTDGQVSRQEVIDGFHAMNATPVATTPVSTDPKDLFAKYDTNHDGSIDLSEMAVATGSDPSNTTDAAKTLAAWDTNNDGLVSSTEFSDGLALIKQATGIIAQYDTAGKGYFDKADLQASIDAGATTNSGATAETMMAFWDTNGDGQVTVPEVLAGLAKNAIPGATSPTNSVPDVGSLLSAYGYSASSTDQTAPTMDAAPAPIA